ncbi:hypothetical protein M758_2G222300 [Ceratodon purpureus]|nr:hypothetical protein M758_2G222300 [Ceratodon purpureus]KAG0627709.1 hypothetical protein M758_2G222300 [Ceratodon purpureus]
MMQAVDKLNLYRDMLQAVPASWSDHQHPTGVPDTMDFTYDGVYNTFTPNAYNAFPSVLSQTLCELDIDNSIHKLFEGLPEILEDTTHASYRDGETALGRPAVTVASAPYFPSTTPAQGIRLNSVSGSVPDVTFTSAHNATPPATFVRPKPAGGQELAPADRKGARARKGKAKGTGTGRGSAKVDAKVPGVSRASPKVLDAIVPSISVARQPSQAHVACIVPKILPATAIPAVDLRAVKTNEVHLVHPSIGLGPQSVLRMPKRSRKDPTLPVANTRTQKTRYFDKVEHIVRERWRRDDMAGKFLALESLLPPSSKRDRSTIVEDSMKLVKSLQHRKEEALKRRAELKLAAQSPGMKLNRIIQKIGSLAVIPMQGNGHTLQESPSSSSMVLSGTKRPLEACTVVVTPGANGDRDQIPQVLSNCVKRFYVQSELSTGDIVIEMICEQIPNFHSILLKSMETLGLEVIRCIVTKTMNKLICNITVKPFPYSASINLSSTSIMEGLSSAFQKV